MSEVDANLVEVERSIDSRQAISEGVSLEEEEVDPEDRPLRKGF